MVKVSDYIVIKITEELREEAMELARGRNKKAKRFGEKLYVQTKNISSGVDTHYYGVIAELCVSKHFRTTMDKEIYDSHGDVGHDLVVGGKTVQVKTTTYTGLDERGVPYLRAEVHKHSDKIDLYLLVAVDVDNVYLIGWIPSSELIKQKPKKLCRTCPSNYIVGPNELEPIRTLK